MTTDALNFFKKHIKQRNHNCGNTFRTTGDFIKHMPKLANHFHYGISMSAHLKI